MFNARLRRHAGSEVDAREASNEYTSTPLKGRQAVEKIRLVTFCNTRLGLDAESAGSGVDDAERAARVHRLTARRVPARANKLKRD